MAKRKPNYCWDTSVWISWLQTDRLADSNLDLVAREVEIDAVNLLVPVTVVTEILETKHSEQKIEEFEAFLERPNIVVGEINIEIAKRARSLRDLCKRNGCTLKTPDAQIIACAIAHRSDVLHTTDPHMLRLDGSPLLSPMRIKKPLPYGGQSSLFDQKP